MSTTFPRSPDFDELEMNDSEVAVYNGQQVSLLSSAGFGFVAAALES